MRPTFFCFLFLLFAYHASAQCDTTLMSHRADGRLASTYAIAHRWVAELQPRCAYREGMSARAYRRWQKGLKRAMSRLMRWPKDDVRQPAARLVSEEARAEYTLQRWECYPMAGVVVPYDVMVPLGAKGPVPAVLCLPGSGQAKDELLRGMGLDYVREGWVAVCVDNAAAGSQADQEPLYPDAWDYDYVVSSRLLLELGWHWLGYTSYIDHHILTWMKRQPMIDRRRIAVSGFSLGTEPMMVLGVLDADICAFVYNDFLCQTQERAVAMTALNERGRRPFPNSIRHLIPAYWQEFNFPDVCCALAPRPIIFTEGGLDRDFRRVRDAYRAAGAEGRAECHHYARYTNPATRSQRETLPEGLTMGEYLPMVNVDAGHHYFKTSLVVPWLREVLAAGR